MAYRYKFNLGLPNGDKMNYIRLFTFRKTEFFINTFKDFSV